MNTSCKHDNLNVLHTQTNKNKKKRKKENRDIMIGDWSESGGAWRTRLLWKGGGILPAQERTGCRAQGNYSWMSQLAPKVKQRNSGIDEGMPTDRSVKSHRAAHQVTLPPSRLFFYPLFIREEAAAHWSLQAGMSHSLSSLWRLMKLPPVRLTARSTLRRLNQQKEKHQWREQHPCVRAFRCGWLAGWVDVFWLLTLN